jgi:hypothetical protein
MRHFVAAAVAWILVGFSACHLQATELTGTWIWSYTVGNQRRESTLRLKFDSEGNFISGTFQASDNHWPIPIVKSTYRDGIFQIVAQSDFGEQDFCVTFSGTSGGGDTIVGQCQVKNGERTRKLDWIARRLK